MVNDLGYHKAYGDELGGGFLSFYHLVILAFSICNISFYGVNHLVGMDSLGVVFN